MEKEEIIIDIINRIREQNDGTHFDFVLPGPLQRKFSGYHSMRNDLQLCEAAIKSLLNDDLNNVTVACLWHTIIALYSKCFTNATDAKLPKLEGSLMFSSNDSNLISTHKKLMELRQSLVAHRGDTEHEVNFVYLRLDIKDQARHVKVKWKKRLRPNKEELSDYSNNIKFLIKAIDKKIYKESEKIWDVMLNKYAPEQLAVLKLAGPKKQL